MRVLQLSIHYNGTGADRCARELYEELPRLGVSTAIWVSNRRPGDPPEVRELRFPWERWLFPMEAFPDLTDWRHRGSIRALRSISNEDFDLVHIHNIHSGWISIRSVYELTKRFPCVWTLHDEWAPKRGLTYELTGKISPSKIKRLSHGPIRYVPYHRYHENYKWRRTREFLRKWLPQAKIVICPSRYMADLAESADVFPNSEIVHIPNGTRIQDTPEATMDRAKAKESFGFSAGRPVVVMVSADLAQAHKGVELAIAALKNVDTLYGLQVLLLGKSAEQVAQGIRPIPTFCAVVSDDSTLARAYRAADVTLIPSLGENFPYVAIESLACGTPLIAFHIGGMPELIGRNERGVVCESLDPLEMSLHVSRLIANREMRDEMGTRGVTWVRQNCDMNRYLNEIVSAYTRAMAPSVQTAFLHKQQ